MLTSCHVRKLFTLRGSADPAQCHNAGTVLIHLVEDEPALTPWRNAFAGGIDVLVEGRNKHSMCHKVKFVEMVAKGHPCGVLEEQGMWVKVLLMWAKIAKEDGERVIVHGQRMHVTCVTDSMCHNMCHTNLLGSC